MGYSREFVKVMRRAASSGCLWIEFDTEGTVHEALPLLREQQPASGKGMLEEWA